MSPAPCPARCLTRSPGADETSSPRYRCFERHFVPKGAADAHKSGTCIEVFDHHLVKWDTAPDEGV